MYERSSAGGAGTYRVLDPSKLSRIGHLRIRMSGKGLIVTTIWHGFSVLVFMINRRGSLRGVMIHLQIKFIDLVH